MSMAKALFMLEKEALLGKVLANLAGEEPA